VDSLASADNSVALGANSIADRANSVSIGSPGAERSLTNVADGTANTDAANMRQLNQVGAMAAAMAGLPTLAYDPDNKFQMSVAGGWYKGQSAAAIGANYYFNDSFMAKAGGSLTNGDNMVTLGLAWKFGHTTKRVHGHDIENMQTQIQEQQTQIQGQQAQIDQLKQMIATK